MSEKSNPIDVANKITAVASGAVFFASAVANFLKPAGVEFDTEIPVLQQIAEHGGNIAVGGLLAVAAMNAIDRIDKKVGGITTAQRIAGVGAMGLVLGIHFNAMTDTQQGMDSIGKYVFHCQNANPAEDSPYCTVDTGDFAWGAVSAGVLAMGVTPWRRPSTANTHVPTHAASSAGEQPAGLRQVSDAIIAVSLPLEQQTTHTFPLNEQPF